MNFFVLFFMMCAFYAHAVFALGQSYNGSFEVQSVARCTAKDRPCCTSASSCTLRYVSKGTWETIQDRFVSQDTCDDVCGVQCQKCFDQCDCVTSQREVQSSAACKCQSRIDEEEINQRCREACISAWGTCKNNCYEAKCPVKARTEMNWSMDVIGACAPFCLSGQLKNCKADSSPPADS